MADLHTGLDERTITDALAQRMPRLALHYAVGADLKRKTTLVVRAFEG